MTPAIITPWQVAKLITLGIFAWFTIGYICVLAKAYFSAVSGKSWFSKQNSQRWTATTNDSMVAPLAVLVLWPFCILIGAVFFVIEGSVNFMESVGDKVVASGVQRERKLRGAVK